MTPAGAGTIRAVRTTRLDVPWRERPAIQMPLGNRELLLVEVECADGLVGTGFLQPLAGGLRTLEACVHELHAPLLVGSDAGAVTSLWQRMWRANYIQGRMGITVMAMSALDIALWDLAGRRLGVPLYRLWGGEDRPLPIYGSGCFRGLGGEGMVAKAQRYVAQGFTAIKMQVAHVHTERQDVANVAAMRAAIGPDVDLLIDVNQGWTADQAIRVGRQLEPFAPGWLEEPVVADDAAGYFRVARALSIPVAGGENHFGRADLRAWFVDGSIPILQPDVMRGGLTEMLRLAHVADTFGMRIAPHLFHELSAHVLAAIPNADRLEYMGWFDDLLVTPLLPVDGQVRPPSAPGHGLQFRDDVVREFRQRD